MLSIISIPIFPSNPVYVKAVVLEVEDKLVSPFNPIPPPVLNPFNPMPPPLREEVEEEPRPPSPDLPLPS